MVARYFSCGLAAACVLAISGAAGQDAASKPDPRVGKELADIFKSFCMDGFPDDAALQATATAKGGLALTVDALKGYLKSSPGHGWRLRTPLGLYGVVIEHPPYRACTVRRMTPEGLNSMQDYIAQVQAFAAARHGVAVAMVQRQIATLFGSVDMTALGYFIVVNGKPTDEFMVILRDDHGHPPAEFAPDAVGGSGVEVSFVRRLVRPPPTASRR